MNQQRGISMVAMLFICIGLVLTAVLGMKVAPSAMQYFTVVKTLKSITSSGELANASVAEVRKVFDKHREVNDINAVTGADLEVSKEGSEIIVSFSYSEKIRLFGPVSLVIDYQGSNQSN